MKKLFLTTALVIAAATSAHAVEAPSLGDRIKSNWDARADRNMWSDPMKSQSEVAPSAPVAEDQAAPAHKGKHHHHHSEKAKAEHAEHKAKAAGMTPEEKAKMKAERKAKWEAMTPEQKAAWKAKHAARKAGAAPATK